jgi:acyl carrier protein
MDDVSAMTANLPTPAEVIDRFLVERCDVAPERLKAETTLQDLGLDSMMLLEVMMEVEDRFGIKLGEVQLPPNPSLGDISALAARHIAAASPT